MISDFGPERGANGDTFARLERATEAAPSLLRGTLKILLSLLIQFDARLRSLEDKKNG